MNVIDITNEESQPKIPIQTRESDIIDLLTDSDDLEVISDITPKPVLKSNVSRQNIINCDIKQPIGSLNRENTKRLLLSPISTKPKPQSAVVFNIIIKNEKSNLGISVVENTKHEFAPKSTPVQKLIGADTSLNSFQNTFPPQFPPDLFKEPQQYNYKNALKDIPPTPTIQIENKGVKVKLTWNLEVKSSIEKIKNYELYACKETVAIPDFMWSKLGDIEPLNLPIVCELDEFIGGFTYYFALRVVDVHNRCSPFAVAHALL